MEHVMAQAPGYNKLMQWTPIPIMPTPGAVGLCMQTTAHSYNMHVVGVDIGGATTDVFSVVGEELEFFNRTVSANLGMSYSISNVLLEAGVPNIMRWVPFKMEEEDLRNRIRNKMIRPTTIPQTLEELIIEQAIAREALRLAFIHHKSLAVGLRGVQRQRSIGDVFDQSGSGDTLIDMMRLGILVGSGGVLSHAPRRVQSALMMLDAFEPEGVTWLTVDSIFMMPQLGVLSVVHPQASAEVFDKDCLVRLGTGIAPAGTAREGEQILRYEIKMPDGKEIDGKLNFGEMRRLDLSETETAEVVLDPARAFDVGAGKGRQLKTKIHGGVAGIIFDGRGRQPIYLPDDHAKRVQKFSEWIEALDVYPMDEYRAIMAKRG